MARLVGNRGRACRNPAGSRLRFGRHARNCCTESNGCRNRTGGTPVCINSSRSFRVLAWGADAASYYAEIRHQLTTTGQPNGAGDMMIAAHALSWLTARRCTALPGTAATTTTQAVPPAKRSASLRRALNLGRSPHLLPRRIRSSISYSRHDSDIVDRLVDEIRETGLRVWIDRHADRHTALCRTIVAAINQVAWSH
jgi:hypothetical protein